MADKSAAEPTRVDGRGYIDDPQPSSPPRTVSPPLQRSGSGSGSSVSEEDSDEVEEEDLARMAGAEAHEEAEHSNTESYPSEVSDWDPEDEDWDLLQGDFTKQYNRMKQLHAAVGSTSTVAPARNQPTQRAAKPKAPGVSVNPKLLNDKHDKDKSDRATQEQVLDARTRLVLAGLTNRGVMGKMNRCISTGKEANVYHADGPDGTAVAVKIYRTSILAFRARQSYMVGEHRFKGEYTSSKNPRKMVRVWAEKELRNLKRLEQGGVPSPKVIEVKQNVLVMEYLGDEENASPRLKDAEILEEDLSRLYKELLMMVRRMFKVCKLVHADLSEYNLLYHHGHIYVIDVSQSVEEEHPHAFEFLRVDISNMEEYFSRRGIPTLGPKRAWDFIVGTHEQDLETLIEEWLLLPKQDDAVFMSSYIPRTLGQVYDPERDIDLVREGKGDQLIYAGITGLEIDPKVKANAHAEMSKQPVSDDEPCDGEVEGSDEESEDELDDGRPRGFRHEDRDAKKERKKAVKEEKRERRKTKMPKSEKQRLMRRNK